MCTHYIFILCANYCGFLYFLFSLLVSVCVFVCRQESWFRATGCPLSVKSEKGEKTYRIRSSASWFSAIYRRSVPIHRRPILGNIRNRTFLKNKNKKSILTNSVFNFWLQVRYFFFFSQLLRRYLSCWKHWKKYFLMIVYNIFWCKGKRETSLYYAGVLRHTKFEIPFILWLIRNERSLRRALWSQKNLVIKRASLLSRGGHGTWPSVIF